jgi:SAM-dependent methyltransferase
MALALSLLILLLYIILIIFTCIFSIVMMYAIIAKVPPLSTNSLIKHDVLQVLKLTSGSYIVDIGCGMGDVLCYCVTHREGVTGYGCEINKPVAYYAKWRTRKLPITVVTKSFTSKEVAHALTKATHVYCYLMPGVIDTVLPLLKTHCRTGTRVVLCDYPFSQMKEKECIVLTHKEKLGKKLFVYYV